MNAHGRVEKFSDTSQYMPVYVIQCMPVILTHFSKTAPSYLRIQSSSLYIQWMHI